MISTRSAELVIDTVVCLTLAKWETVSGQFGGYLIGNDGLAAIGRHVRGIGMFENLKSQDRINLARAKMTRVLDHFLYLLELHANNAHVVYSPLLSSQISQSFAAN